MLNRNREKKKRKIYYRTDEKYSPLTIFGLKKQKRNRRKVIRGTQGSILGCLIKWKLISLTAPNLLGTGKPLLRKEFNIFVNVEAAAP